MVQTSSPTTSDRPLNTAWLIPNPTRHLMKTASTLIYLSSMRMCLNLFGQMWADLTLADKAVHAWWPDAPGKVSAVEFEWSPGRSRMISPGDVKRLFADHESTQDQPSHTADASARIPEAIRRELTPREEQIVHLMLDGYDNRSIAEQLSIAERTETRWTPINIWRSPRGHCRRSLNFRARNRRG